MYLLAWFCISRGLYSLVDWNQAGNRLRPHHLVEAYTASWIEIPPVLPAGDMQEVEAYTASWIEISVKVLAMPHTNCRGLYSLVDWNEKAKTEKDKTIRRGLYSLVDWNTAVFAAPPAEDGRGLYSLVDWNGWEGRCRKSKYVEAYIVPLIEYFFL